MSNMPRVLVLSHMYPYPNDSTNGIFVRRQVEAVAQGGFDVRVVRPVPFIPKWAGQRLRNQKCRAYTQLPLCAQVGPIIVFYLRYLVLPFAWFHPLGEITLFLSLVGKLKYFVERFHPDIVHSYNATPGGYAGLLLSKRWNLKHVCSLRGSDINLYPINSRLTFKLTKKVLLESDRIVSVSNKLRSKALAVGRPRKEIRIIYNGCDFEMFDCGGISRVNVRNRLGIPEKGKVLVYVGHLRARKGVYDVLEIFKRIADYEEQVYLIIIGDGEERDALDSKLRRLSVGRRVSLKGRLEQREIAPFLCASDVFVFPSHSEGLPNAVLEAMACGLPVVAYAVGGIPEIVYDGNNGFLIEKGNIERFSRTVKYLIDNKEVCKNMGSQGRKVVEERFSWKRSARELGGIYVEVCNEYKS